ncbi:Tex family protein [Haliovirga abyssi]|uniref:Transcription accessory protein n=1 Tax=Haliovirga abyssi TaxID=2996794 RepID=A0AAU9DAG6_9FUSO|nr:Tex family protein [Haliovirga abyssi]BDU50335.1 transcription accessory protein [Haliovirga abyssi]
MDLVKIVEKELNLNHFQVENTLKLSDDGATVPFIARYRKEMTGNLNEEQIRDVLDRINYLRNLEKRKEEVLVTIEEQGKLTEELKTKIVKAIKLQEVEDLYLPYKKKRKTKADIAKERGLEPLAIFMQRKDINIKDINSESEKYINEEITTIEEALDGAKLIIAQEISENIKYREFIRDLMSKKGKIISSVIEKNREKDEKGVYQDYYDYSENVKYIPSHRIMAVNRGEKEKIIRVAIKFDDISRDRILNFILYNYKNINLKNLYVDIINDSLDRLILPSIEREVRNILTEQGENDSIKIFQKNLKNLLMQPPIYEKNILGIDPGYRTGCKIVVINKLGFFIKSDVVYLVSGDKKLIEAKEKIKKLILENDIDLVVIGNGTGSRETEKLTAEIISENDFGKKVYYVIANEAGASVYSASKLAKEEFPDLDVTERGGISIARRVQDPLAELVKIDSKSIGVGMYQHDVNQKKLGIALENTVESVVNDIGVNLNTASWALLSFVSGINKKVAKNIMEYRNENGKFKSRKELKKVKGLGEKAYTLAAGFIVVPESKNVLDNTIIHPESYSIAEEILKDIDSNLKEFKNNTEEVISKLRSFDIKGFIDKTNYGEETVKDIYASLLKPKRDPRENLPQPLLKENILKMSDLKEGMELEGTVRNVVKFGAFIDIGLKNDALLHVSEMGKKFIQDATLELEVGDIVKVKIKELDEKRGRVSLTMKG